MQHQDWDPVVICSSASTSARSGVKSKGHSSAIKNISAGVQAIRKLEDTPISTKPQMLTGKSRSEMAQIRVSKGWTQKQLDMNGQFPTNSCNGWESGKLCPTGPQLQKLHRILGIKLERE